jgi:hypothetical protein
MLEIYFNLHKMCLSVRSKGLVIKHADQITLSNVTFKVREGGRQRVIKEKKKNVHAFVKGMEIDKAASDKGRRVSYNPYKAGHFYYVDSGEPVYTANEVSIIGKAIYVNN